MIGRDLSSKEKKQLYYKCATLTVVVVFIFFAYLVRLQQNSLLNNMKDFIILWGMPLMILVPLVATISYELLYHRRTKEPARFHIKRLGLTMLQIIALTLPLMVFMLLMDSFLEPAIGNWSIIIACALWIVMLAAVVIVRQRLSKNSRD